jgi:hypothetical protein
MKGGLYQGIVALAVRRDIKGDLYDVAYNLKTSALGTAIENNFDYGVLRRRSREQKSKKLPSPRKAAVDTSSPTSSLDPPSSPSLTSSCFLSPSYFFSSIWLSGYSPYNFEASTG